MVEKCKKCGHEQDMEVCDWCRAEEMHEEEIRELYGGGANFLPQNGQNLKGPDILSHSTGSEPYS